MGGVTDARAIEVLREMRDDGGIVDDAEWVAAVDRAIAALSAQPRPPVDRVAIQMLVAAGFVTEAKVSEALSIAHGFTKGELPPQPASAPVWQTMETAPKDGTAFLALLPGSDIPKAVRYGGAVWHISWDGSRLGEFDQPRKWMRIPDEGERTAFLAQQPAAVDEAWTDAQCLAFAACAFRHAPKNLPEGVTLADIRIGAQRALAQPQGASHE